MIDKYLEVEQVADGFVITDWTDWFQSHLEKNNYREMALQHTGYIRISGKTTNYNIKGFGKDVKRAHQFAIWYHVNKHSGNVSKYRLD